MVYNFLKHELSLATVSLMPAPLLFKLTGTRMFVGYYHLVSDSDTPHIKHLYPYKTVKQFSDDLDYLVAQFNPININDVLAYSKYGRQLPAKAFCLTFDDGFREMHDIVAPILLKKGIEATFFLNSGFIDNQNLCYQHKASLIVEYFEQHSISEGVRKEIEGLIGHVDTRVPSLQKHVLAIKYDQRELVDKIADVMGIDSDNYLQKNKPYLTCEQINNLIKDGFTIGAHSIDHPLYVDLTLEEQLHQTLDSVRLVKNMFNLNYGAFAFPHSDLGVSKQYYDEVAKSGLVDISFGTAGIIADCVPHNFQRLSLERPLVTAKKIIAIQSAKKIYRLIKGRNTIRRA